MLGLLEFTFCEGRHRLTSWTDNHYAPPDAGTFWLELDSLGEIYVHSTSETGFRVVRSDNDSVNALILMAMSVAYSPCGFAMRHPLPPVPKINAVDFTAVEIHDTATGGGAGAVGSEPEQSHLAADV